MSTSSSWWRGKAILVLLLAAILTVVYKLGDAYVVTHLINAPDPLVATFTYLVMGATVGLSINYLLCQTPAGKFINESFTSIKHIDSGPMKYAFITGLFGALSTGVYLWAFRSLDPSLVVPLSSLMLVYVVIIEVFRGRIKFGVIMPSLIMVLVGIAIASYNPKATWQITLGTLVLLLVFHNGINAAGEILSKEAVDQADPVTFAFWRFFWLTVSAYVLSIGSVLVMGKFGQFVTSLITNLPAVLFVSLVMVVVFFAQGFASKGLKMSTAAVKNLVMSLPTVFTVLATAAINFVLPGTFALAPATGLEWVLRFVGAVLITWGVVRLPRK